MSAMPVAPFLSEFGGAAPARRDAPFAPFGSEAGAAGKSARAGSMVDRVEAARASGFASGEAAATAALEATVAGLGEQHALELAAAREAWVRGEADNLAHQLAAGLRDLETRIADATARVLAPLLRAEVVRQAITDLNSELARLLANAADVSLSISGPEDLLQALRVQLADQLAGKTVSVDYRQSEEPDVRIVAGQTVLETRLGVWAAKIGEAFALRARKPRPRSSSSSAAAPAVKREATTVACGRSPMPTS